MEKEVHLFSQPQKLTADRPPPCTGVELCNLNLTNLGYVADRSKTRVYFFLHALYEKGTC